MCATYKFLLSIGYTVRKWALRTQFTQFVRRSTNVWSTEKQQGLAHLKNARDLCSYCKTRAILPLPFAKQEKYYFPINSRSRESDGTASIGRGASRARALPTRSIRG